MHWGGECGDRSAGGRGGVSHKVVAFPFSWPCGCCRCRPLPPPLLPADLLCAVVFYCNCCAPARVVALVVLGVLGVCVWLRLCYPNQRVLVQVIPTASCCCNWCDPPQSFVPLTNFFVSLFELSVSCTVTFILQRTSVGVRVDCSSGNMVGVHVSSL